MKIVVSYLGGLCPVPATSFAELTPAELPTKGFSSRYPPRGLLNELPPVSLPPAQAGQLSLAAWWAVRGSEVAERDVAFCWCVVI